MAASPEAVPPKHAVRATRSSGRKTRSRLLDEASRLFRTRGLADVSISDIAAAADAFPSQITYYFRSKEALFVEAACRDVLHLADDTERAAKLAVTPETYTRTLVEHVMRAGALAFFVEAMMLSRRRIDLREQVERTILRLHDEGVRAYAGEVARHGWVSRHDPAVTAKRFWTIAIGLTVEGQAIGRSAEQQITTMLDQIERQADSPVRSREKTS